MKITELQRQMDAACGHEVEIIIAGGFKPLKGKCVNFTKPLDSDDGETASMDVRVPGFSSLYEITEDEIEKLTILED